MDIIKRKIKRRCKCGCGKTTNPGRKWVIYHHRRNQKASDETRKKMSLAIKGKMCGKNHPMYGKRGKYNPNYGSKRSDKTRKKMSLAHMGRISPMLGKCHSEETKRKIGLAQIGRRPTKETRLKISLARKGKKLSEEHKKNLSISHTGKKLSKETKLKMSVVRQNVSKETKNKMSLAQLECWKDPEFVQKQMKARNVRQNKAELKLERILNNLFPNEYKYTGDFSFMINGKCPDFVNINGQKKLIELYGDYWHKGDNPQDRIDIFTPFGYNTLVIWEHELKESRLQLRKRLKEFHRS